MHHVRLTCGVVLFLASELMLFGAAEGMQKWTWIEAGTIPNALLAIGFCFKPRLRSGPRQQG